MPASSGTREEPRRLALRIIEAHVPPDLRGDAQEALREFSHESWVQESGRFGAIAFTAAAILGLALDADPATSELAPRTRVEVWDLVLALAAGCAGALSYTTGVPTYLTGVMVAVALLPPAVASGMLLAQGQPGGAFAALLLAALAPYCGTPSQEERKMKKTAPRMHRQAQK